MNKTELRKEMKQKRDALSGNEVLENSEIIFKKIYSDACYQSNDTIYTYVNFQNEVETIRFINQCLKSGKKVAAPKISGNQMDFFYISSMDDLKPGYYGILEPENTRLACAEKYLMIMPGLIFDLSRNRIGYGGGFYDKYLARHINDSIDKYAVAYDFQILQSVEATEHDIKPDKIFTPTRILT